MIPATLQKQNQTCTVSQTHLQVETAAHGHFCILVPTQSTIFGPPKRPQNDHFW